MINGVFDFEFAFNELKVSMAFRLSSLMFTLLV